MGNQSDNRTSTLFTAETSQSIQQLPKRIAIIGGGLAGMSAAHRLQELAREQGTSLEVCLFESASHLGGIVGTEQIGEYLVDVGADSFLTNKPGAVGLCRRLGIEDRLIPTDSRFRGAFVLYKGRPIPVPEGFQLLSPTAIWPMLTTPLLSVGGKCRMLMEWFVPARSSPPNSEKGSDESVADFVRRRFGREALERLIQPLVGGIYTSDPERLSLAATMPRFIEMERQHGSLIRAALRSKRNETSPSNPSDSSSGARYGLFAGLKGGIQDLVQALRVRVESTCNVRTGCAVKSVQKENSPRANSAGIGSGGYRLIFSDDRVEQFDAVIVATSTIKAAEILNKLDSSLSHELGAIEYASSALVVTGHRLCDVENPLNSFGLVVPHIEKRKILAVSFSSRKFPDRAPADRVLLRTFVGGALQPELFNIPDDEMTAMVKSELSAMLGVRSEPDFVRIYRYPNSMPQYYVGHLDRVSRIEEQTRRFPHLALAGIGYRGVGVPDVISSGECAAETVLHAVSTNNQDFARFSSAAL